MLVGFSLQNYKSFKETQSLSMVAAKHTRHKNHLKTLNNRNVLTAAAVYGANASGKSNLCSAMTFSKRVMEGGFSNMNLNKSYFRLDPDWTNKPGVFEYRIAVNSHEYEYGLAVENENSKEE